MKLLILEDELILQFFYTKVIKLKFAGKIELFCVGTVTEALKLCEEHRFDLFVLDFNLPDGTAVDLLAKTKQFTPTIIISSNDKSVLIEFTKNFRQVKECYSKPLDVNTFVEIIDFYLDVNDKYECAPSIFFKESSYAF